MKAARALVLAPLLLLGGSSDDLRALVSTHLPQIQTVPLKRGAPTWDRHYNAIRAKGTHVAPFLAEHLTNDAPSLVFEYFPHSQGDVAHVLLCDLYDRDLTWPVAGQAPIGGHPSVSFFDYLALVGRASGRFQLADAWARVIQSHAPAGDA